MANGSRLRPAAGRGDSSREIYVMNADGTGLQRLTNNTASDTRPSWSPDGTKIVFASNRDGNFEL
jgi:Tol biopolymer transport system component